MSEQLARVLLRHVPGRIWLVEKFYLKQITENNEEKENCYLRSTVLLIII